MPAILRQHVRYQAAKSDEGAALFKASELTTREAAELANVTLERIRQIVESHEVGRWVERLQCYAIDRGKLEAYLGRKRGRRG
jgi:hypothetical protein